jgi:prepilin-type N-terminal cleavage/methylation domain-containing protein
MNRGYTLIEVIFVLALVVVMAGVAIPVFAGAVERSRASAAAAYVSGRLMLARLEAVKRSAFVGVQFAQQTDGYWIRTYVDGNGDGVLARDISRGIDVPLGPPTQLEHQFPGVRFGICPGVTAIVPGDAFDPTDPIQIGQSTVMSFNPNGSSTAGTVYIRGDRANQLAVRVLGTTARSRVMRFDFQDGRWRTQ